MLGTLEISILQQQSCCARRDLTATTACHQRSDHLTSTYNLNTCAATARRDCEHRQRTLKSFFVNRAVFASCTAATRNELLPLHFPVATMNPFWRPFGSLEERQQEVPQYVPNVLRARMPDVRP
jgi:hypothetical protein